MLGGSASFPPLLPPPTPCTPTARHSLIRARPACITQEVNRELRDALIVGAEDASVALSDAPRKQRALLARIEGRLAEVQREVGALGLGERDKSLVR